MRSPNRCIRIDDETWSAVRKAAANEGVDVAEWVRSAIGARLDPGARVAELEHRVAVLSKALGHIRAVAGVVDEERAQEPRRLNGTANGVDHSHA